MIVLGFDTSTSATAVALRLADGRALDARDDPPAGAHPGHATRLLELAHGLLAQAGLSWSAVERVAVGVGPGTFTGLRVGIATARGLAQSLDAELVGVSSLAALAVGAFAAEDGFDTVVAVIDARRGEAFAATFARGGEDGGPRVLAGPGALAPERLAELASTGGDTGRALAVGDGAVRFRGHLEAAGVVVPSESSPLHLVSAVAVCELGAQGAASERDELVPDYQRRPDAELALRSAGRAGAPSDG